MLKINNHLKKSPLLCQFLTEFILNNTIDTFEFYLFHFAFHLINSWQPHMDPNFYGGHETVYLHLSDQYLQHFLPIESSIVLPIIPVHQTIQLPRSPPPPQVKLF